MIITHVSLPCLYQYISIDIFISICGNSKTLSYNNSPELSLLSKTELEWLLENKTVSKSFGYKIKSTIKKKIENLLSFELPLLIQTQILDKELIQDILDNPNNMLPSLGKEKVRYDILNLIHFVCLI